jgi:hypothetical protein
VTFPLAHRVTHRTSVKVGENALGQPIVEPLDRRRRVYGWAPWTNRSGAEPAHDNRTVVELALLVPDSNWPHGSLVRLPNGSWFRVVGGVDDYSGGPFGFRPGGRVRIRKVEDSDMPGLDATE